MNILMMTNTYTPIVGGLERSIESFTKEFRRRGDRVMIVAPKFKNQPKREYGVIRIPAIQNFSGSEFSVKLPMAGFFIKALGGFKPNIIHAHHPFLMGDTALRLAYAYKAPLIFTHHTLYEQYIHWTPTSSDTLKKFVINLSTGYANLCDRVIAPSESVSKLLKERGVTTPIVVIPTGLHLEQFQGGTGARFRREANIPAGGFVVGYVGRLVEAKNLMFLARAVAAFLKKEKKASFLVIGSGPLAGPLLDYFKKNHLERRFHLAGEIDGKRLAEAYHAMDVFAFSSQSETQGMVLSEAMAAGTPVVAVDAPGVRDVVEDRLNGRLVSREDERDFSRALSWVFEQPPDERQRLTEGAKATAEQFSIERCAAKMLKVYESLRAEKAEGRRAKKKILFKAVRGVKAEWDLLSNFTKATMGALK